MKMLKKSVILAVATATTFSSSPVGVHAFFDTCDKQYDYSTGARENSGSTCCSPSSPFVMISDEDTKYDPNSLLQSRFVFNWEYDYLADPTTIMQATEAQTQAANDAWINCCTIGSEIAYSSTYCGACLRPDQDQLFNAISVSIVQNEATKAAIVNGLLRWKEEAYNKGVITYAELLQLIQLEFYFLNYWYGNKFLDREPSIGCCNSTIMCDCWPLNNFTKTTGTVQVIPINNTYGYAQFQHALIALGIIPETRVDCCDSGSTNEGELCEFKTIPQQSPNPKEQEFTFQNGDKIRGYRVGYGFTASQLLAVQYPTQDRFVCIFFIKDLIFTL